MPRLVPLGDQAVLAYLPDEAAAVRFAASVRAAAPPWLHDVTPAYGSVGVFFDADAVDLPAVVDWLERVGEPADGAAPPPGRLVHIPVCYDLGPDLNAVAADRGLTPAEVVRLHSGNEYTVYAVGFVPGFPYLGYLPERLCGVGRLASPRVRVDPGSVGVTGRQTAIYPLPRPGGWHLIGRTPLVLVDVAAGFFPLRVGDRVWFDPIGRADYDRLAGRRLGGPP